MNPSSQNNKKQEMEKLQQQFDQATGRVPSKPQPWHTEKGLSKATRDLLDAQEPQQRLSGGFYSETPEQKKQQEAFDALIKNTPVQGAGTWQATPPTKKERLLAWHRSLGSPKHVVDAELKALEEQEARK
jgi:hypothetical protein